MKSYLLTLMSLFFLIGLKPFMQAQELKPTLAVLNIDNDGLEFTPEQLASLARIEVLKLGQFSIMDPYDIAQIFAKNNFDASLCYGKICLIEAGKILKVDKILSGSVEILGNNLILTLRQLDINSGDLDLTNVMEFVNVPGQVHVMISFVVQKLYGQKIDDAKLAKLTRADDFESTINMPDADVLNLSGPRVGLNFLTGEAARVQKLPKSEGGYNALPIMSTFGYQFEANYLNSGNLQALFEFIPIISGLDQGRFIPSFTILTGLRSNKNGFEFAVGPNIFLYQVASGFYNSEDIFILGNGDRVPDEFELERRIDSRGKTIMGSGLVIAFGKTFRSGKMNLPLNVFYIPGKTSQRFGISFGFNIYKS